MNRLPATFRNRLFPALRRIMTAPRVLFAGGMLLTLFTVRVAADFNGLYGQDSHEYLRYCRRWVEFLTTGASPGDYFWPVNYPLWGALLTLLTGDAVWALQLLSMISVAVTVLYVERFLRRLYPEISRRDRWLYPGLFLFLAPLFFRSGLLVMSDALATAFTLAGLYHACCYGQDQRRKHLWWAAFFIASAVMTRYQTAVVLLLPVVLLFRHLVRYRRWGDGLAALAIAGACFVPHLYVRGEHWADFLNHAALTRWSLNHWWMSEFHNQTGYFHYRWPNLVYAFSHLFHPGFLLPGVFFLLSLRFRDWPSREHRLLAFLAGVHSLFLAGIPFQSLRFLLPAFPLVILLLFPAYHRIRRRFFSGKAVGIIFVVLLIGIQGALIRRYLTPLVELNREEREIAEAVRQVAPQRPIYTFAIDGALRSYGVKNPIINLWAEALAGVDTTAVVLFNESRFARTFAGKTPMQNWEFIRRNYPLDTLAVWPNGWVLVEVSGSGKNPP